MLLSLSILDVDWSFSVNEMGGARDGVFAPELPDDGLPVDIFSLSLSDSSPLAVLLVVYRRDIGMVKEDSARGLWILLSDKNEARGGASRLGLRKRISRGLNSSASEFDGEECRAKSDEEAGNDGRKAMVVVFGVGVVQDRFEVVMVVEERDVEGGRSRNR